MDLKNAAAVCLIALFSATLVVLIARSLDNQAAARLEPRLAEIAEELRAIRGQGGLAAAPEGSAASPMVRDGLVVYYFHSNTRCPTCQSIESQAQAVVQKDFAAQLGKGEMVWKIANYEQASAKPLAEKFAIQMPVVVLVRMKNGEIEDWRRLDKVWAFESDKPAFAEYVRGEIDRMLASTKTSSPAEAKTPAIPLPNAENESAKETPAIPIP